MTEARERWKQIHDEMVAATRRPGRLFWDACKRIAELEASLTTLKDMREQWNANVERIRELEAENAKLRRSEHYLRSKIRAAQLQAIHPAAKAKHLMLEALSDD